MSDTATTDKGWAFVGSTRRAHYYDARDQSLCGRYAALFVPAEAFEAETGRTSPDDCAACRRRIDRRGVK